MGHPPWIQEMWVQILARLPSQLELELRRPAPTWAPAVTSYAGRLASSFLSESFSIVEIMAIPLSREVGPVSQWLLETLVHLPVPGTLGTIPMGKPYLV